MLHLSPTKQSRHKANTQQQHPGINAEFSLLSTFSPSQLKKVLGCGDLCEGQKHVLLCCFSFFNDSHFSWQTPETKPKCLNPHFFVELYSLCYWDIFKCQQHTFTSADHAFSGLFFFFFKHLRPKLLEQTKAFSLSLSPAANPPQPVLDLPLLLRHTNGLTPDGTEGGLTIMPLY